MDWLIEPFAFGFQQRAFLGAALAAVATALVGTWVIVRGMTFLGDALVHGVIPGLALAVVLEVPPIVGAAAAAAVMIGGINLVHRQTAFNEDTGIGLLFVGMLGLGVILVSRTPSFAGSLTTLLFGDVLGVTAGDIGFVAVVAVVSIVVSLAFYRHFLVLSFNEQKAKLFGLRPGLAHALLLGLMTLAIVGSSQTVGTLLVFGLLVGPPATAALLVRRVPTMMVTAAAIGVVSVGLGLVVSYHADIAGSATMAVVPIVLFFCVLGYRQLAPRR
ncbi:MAG TPA: zinc ABC transporter permease AztB [Acidimicrobiia bacterium]|nr:zinc ABC transporter permease AztB [Acidimicrobiia bacterium]